MTTLALNALDFLHGIAIAATGTKGDAAAKLVRAELERCALLSASARVVHQAEDGTTQIRPMEFKEGYFEAPHPRAALSAPVGYGGLNFKRDVAYFGDAKVYDRKLTGYPTPVYLAPPPDPWRAVAEGLAKALEDADEVQPCTAERPSESNYELGRFQGVMDFQSMLRKITRPALAAFAAAKDSA